MICVCSYCNQVYGEREPLSNESVTHGACPECGEREMKKLREGDNVLRQMPQSPRKDQETSRDDGRKEDEYSNCGRLPKLQSSVGCDPGDFCPRCQCEDPGRINCRICGYPLDCF